MTPSRDRSSGYVPDGMPTGPTDNRVLVGPSDRPLVLKHGLPDELNRDGTWWWAQTGGRQPDESVPAAMPDGAQAEHWSHFMGHKVLVDVAYRPQNRREVNDWKGRDEIRPEGNWLIRFNRTQVWEGWCTLDFAADLRRIATTAERLLAHDAVDWMSQVPYSRQLEGRAVWYRSTAARVASVVLDQGCVMLRPEPPVERFPPPQYALDRLQEYDDSEEDEVKVDLLDSNVWWWRG